MQDGILVHLVDGTFELFRAFYGAPAAKNRAGREIGAVRGLIRSMASLLKSPGVSHVAVAFDHVIESFRNELFAGYKTSEGIEPELWQQFPLAEEATLAFGMVTWSMVDFEADDALATGADRYAKDSLVKQIILCSPDKDLAQCVVGSRVVYWDRVRGSTYDADAVEEKFGVPCAAIPDFLALVGDTADGIPGIPGFGAKSAASVLAAYKTLEAIPRTKPWTVKVRGEERLRTTFAAAYDEALLYRKLATLRRDVPLKETLDDLQWRGPTTGFAAFAREVLADEKLADAFS